MSDAIGFNVLCFMAGAYLALGWFLWLIDRRERKLIQEHRAEMQEQELHYQTLLDAQRYWRRSA